MINQSEVVIMKQPLHYTKKLPAHPLICWLSQLFRPLDPWVEIKIPVGRDTVFSYNNRLFMSPEQSRMLNMKNIS